jgi:hypothetical protein
VRHFPVRWKVARVTGLEPATSGVTGRHSNQLSYTRVSRCDGVRRGEGRRLGGGARQCQAPRLWIFAYRAATASAIVGEAVEAVGGGGS